MQCATLPHPHCPAACSRPQLLLPAGPPSPGHPPPSAPSCALQPTWLEPICTPPSFSSTEAIQGHSSGHLAMVSVCGGGPGQQGGAAALGRWTQRQPGLWTEQRRRLRYQCRFIQAPGPVASASWRAGSRAHLQWLGGSGSGAAGTGRECGPRCRLPAPRPPGLAVASGQGSGRGHRCREEEQDSESEKGLFPEGPEEEDGDAFSFKYSPGKLRGNQYKKMMTKEEVEEEQRLQKEQLAAIFRLMRDNSETFGEMSEGDVQEQLRLYDM
nr:matrix-remodeling-associated protein 7 isoform X1 [Oryctolagus cuniculus]